MKPRLFFRWGSWFCVGDLPGTRACYTVAAGTWRAAYAEWAAGAA